MMTRFMPPRSDGNKLVSVTQSVVVENGALISLEESSPGKHAKGGGEGGYHHHSKSR